MDVVSQILNFVYFAVGLGVGIFGIYLSITFFKTQQQDKFNQIAGDLANIRVLLAEMAAITSEQAAGREDRLLTLAVHREKEVAGALSRRLKISKLS